MSCEVKNRIFLIVIIVLIAVVATVGYNESFGNLVNYMNSVESLLAKSMISKNPQHGAETLTEVWRDANLALVHLGRIPMNTEELSRNC